MEGIRSLTSVIGQTLPLKMDIDTVSIFIFCVDVMHDERVIVVRYYWKNPPLGFIISK